MAKANNSNSNNKRKAASSNSTASANKKASKPNSKKVEQVVEAEVEDSSDLIGGVIFPEELESTIEVLTALSQNPEMLKSKQLKGFKGAMWDCWRALQETTGTGSSLTSRISTTLQSSLHLESLILLSELRLRSITPKLGSLQRWVRECDAAAISSAGTKNRSVEEEEKEESMVWEVLDAILRATTKLGQAGAEAAEGVVETDVGRGLKGVRKWREWDARGQGVEVDVTGKRNLYKEAMEGTLVSESQKATYLTSVIPLDTTPGPSRRPPNLFPAIVYHAATPTDLAFAPSSGATPVLHHVPGVPGAMLITDVLSKNECIDLVSMSESVGMIEDKPVGGSAAELNSILAHNLILLAPPQLIDPLFARVQNLLPSHLPVPAGSKSSGALVGINRRFRIYRYKEGSVYRPHVDGAWPSSSEIAASEDGTVPAQYVYDSDPKVYSRFTFLLYLNDSFGSGQTTFFIPDPNRDGVIDARPVRPIQGAALIFPHGATEGSLLHEGSPVHPSPIEGAKYVIRTEVLYEVDRMASAGEGGVVGGLV
ncbi:hypothetical protein BDY24DRAFT_433048 [Mrakia frigida]|uniref:uncharacterized protein n=1 Tax=Mrakia frigida TaxID=29902 RepID=UPI003FCC261C